MQIQFLGTGDAFCSGGRYQTCFLVKIPEYQFLIDCGATSMMALNALGIDSNLIEGIVISHFHGDHFGGLPFLLLDANFTKNRKQPLTISGPPGISGRVVELMEMMYPKSMKKLSFTINFMEYSPSKTLNMGPVKIESFPVVHVPESLPHGLRVSADDRVFSFSGDTGWTDNLNKISDSADLFICECNFFSTSSPSHLDYQTIMNEKQNFNCKRIILNHLGGEMLENLSEVELECSYDGLVVEV